jgi:hypothetical protein
MIAMQIEQDEAVMWEEEGKISFLRMDYDPVTQVKCCPEALVSSHYQT